MILSKNSFIARLFTFAGNHRKLLILSCFLSSLSSILSIGPFICIWFVMRDLLRVMPDYAKAVDVVQFGWMAVGFAVASIILYFAALFASHLAAFRVETNMRKAAMHRIVNLPLGYFRTNASGKLRKVIDDNASLTHSFLAHQLPDLAGVVIMPLVVLSVFFIFDWRLGLVCLLPTLLSLFFLQRMMGGDRAERMNQYLNALEDMNTAAVEYVRGIPVVKVFQQTVYSFKNFHEAITNYWQFASGFAISCRVPMVGYILTINGPSLLLIPTGLLLIMTAHDYKVFLLDLLFYMLFVPLSAVFMSKIMYTGESTMAAKEAVDRIYKILEAVPLPEGKKNKAPKNAEVSFLDVSFTYLGNTKPAVKNISFTIPEGKTFALVGSSGSGKSTIASLAARFWDVDSGSITIGGIDVRAFQEEALMQRIAFVFQNTKLFKTSLLENICAAKSNAGRQEALHAAHLAQCDDILRKMPKGIDTYIGSDGVYLSGGEQQRIALARAILKDAPIVILDEATAFADPENEYQIQKAFEHLIKGKTVLMIAHRLSSIKNVDCILVMENGEIVEQGTHDYLLELNGIYADMWKEYQTAIAWKVGKETAHA
ncbi:MAG: ABC transporter ATP-binding protein [Negativicutes bacterium]|nr:ABC transporter ATP-binding protein [Negativicutes bacterium]